MIKDLFLKMGRDNLSLGDLVEVKIDRNAVWDKDARCYRLPEQNPHPTTRTIVGYIAGYNDQGMVLVPAWDRDYAAEAGHGFVAGVRGGPEGVRIDASAIQRYVPLPRMRTLSGT